MKIAYEARALAAQGGGVKTYTRELLKHLTNQTANEHEFHAITTQAAASSEYGIAINHTVPLYSEALLPLWLSYQVPRTLRQIQPDVVHYTKAAIPRRITLPTAVTIYDIIPLLFPESQTWARSYYWAQALEHAALKSHHILTISETSKRDIMNRFEVPFEKVTVTPLAVNTTHFSRVEDASRMQHTMSKLGITAPYFLFVGTRDVRKNLNALIRAFHSIAEDVPHSLVIAGKQALHSDNIQQEIWKHNLDSRVHVLDYVSYDDLPVLYSGADVFVWPSVYEGWGFPPQEAMACGTPVIVSDGGPLPEVVGSAGEIVRFSTNILQDRTHDEQFTQALADRMASIALDKVKQSEMRARGLQEVAKNSWDNVARATLSVYKQLANI